jgi:S1-C subfamily serine protease
MKIKLLLAIILSTGLYGQKMRFDTRLYYDEKPISLAEAKRISKDISEDAYKEFSSAFKAYPVFGISTLVGVSYIRTAFDASKTNVPAIIIGSCFISGGTSWSYFYRGKKIKKGVSLFNEAIKNQESTALDRERQKEKLRLERVQKELAEKNKIDRFYAMLTERLSEPLTQMEGVYKSIDRGEAYEYDIVVLSSLTNNDEYIGVVLKSTDPSLSVGDGLFTFNKTVQANLYFVSYQNKAGKTFENKTAQLDGAVLTMGVKSFVKMYPNNNENRKYSEINPLFDWESSGSGVLINNEGYIVTNNHVAAGAKKIRIAFQNDSTDYNAVIISQNEATDVAILKIQDDRFKSKVEPVNWETNFKLGQKVFTLGYPISNKMSNNVKVVDGIVSGENGVGGSPVYFQTTLPVWYGNSGGPCFNSKGEILGLATQILWDKGAKVDNVAYITKTENILSLGGDLIENESETTEDKGLEQLIEELIPYSVFIKVNY